MQQDLSQADVDRKDTNPEAMWDSGGAPQPGLPAQKELPKLVNDLCNITSQNIKNPGHLALFVPVSRIVDLMSTFMSFVDPLQEAGRQSQQVKRRRSARQQA